MATLAHPRGPTRDHHVNSARTARPNLTLFATSLGTFVAILDTSIVNLALHSIQRGLQTGVGTLQWIMDAYTIVYAAFILTGGALADRWGRRNVFALGMAIFGVGSLVCALAPTAAVLVAGRAISGLGAALELPASLAILNVSFDGAKRSRAIAIWASANGLAMGVGPTVGGLLLAAFGWRSLFLIVIPFVLITLVVTMVAVADSRGGEKHPLDLPGQALAIAALGLLCLALIQAPSWGWRSPLTILGLALCTASAIGFVVRERRARAPMLPPKLFSNPAFSAGLAIAVMMTVGFYILLFVFPLYLQITRGHSPLRTGLELLPQSATFFLVSSLVTGALVSRMGPRWMVAMGFALSTLAMIGLAVLPGHAPDVVLAGCLLLSGLGLGLMTGPVSNVPVANAPKEQSGTSSGAVNVARMVGATFGIAIVGSFLGGTRTPPTGAEVEHGMRLLLGLAAVAQAIGACAAIAFFRRDSLKS